MARILKLHDVVALLRDLPGHRMRRGQVGTIVERYKSGHYEVEFADDKGQTFALVTLSGSHLLQLSYNRGTRRNRAKLVA